MNRNQIWGVFVGFIVGTVNYVVFSPWVFRGSLTKPQEIFAFWLTCTIFMLLFYSLNNLKKAVIVGIVLILIPIIGMNFYSRYSQEMEIKKIHKALEKYGINNPDMDK